MLDNPIPHRLIEGTVVGRVDWTERLFSLKVKAQMIPFKAGQFTKLALPTAEGEWSRRAYSLVNAPDDEILEFLLVTVPDGELSPRLDALQPGDPVYVGEEPAGFMTLEEIPETARDLWMLSTGTAIGPFLSMLADSASEVRFERLVLVHAVRKEAELVYQERIVALQERLGKRLHYVPVVSRETVPYALTGRIPTLLSAGTLSQVTSVELDPLNSFFLICGNPEMVRDSRETLQKMGYRKHLRRKPGQFSSENYW
ncbi:ferredoxin--NADP reductase [Photobacterium sagamiensis]|uniref:ferredoxin--NADP reductase n=1 Tax=Photobacterium sagamiensis TaxID=2910241 RepID=UPI003D0A9BF4